MEIGDSEGKNSMCQLDEVGVSEGLPRTQDLQTVSFLRGYGGEVFGWAVGRSQAMEVTF